MKSIEWREIDGYKGLYEVSNTGLIRGLDRQVSIANGNKRIAKGQILKTRTNKKGYIDVCLNKNDTKKSYQVHRLVAQAFIPNEGNMPQVNHINGCKSCNEVSNLEWTDAKGNTQHAIQMGLRSQDGCNHWLAVPIIDIVTGQYFCTIKAFCDHYGINYVTGKRALKGQQSFPKHLDLSGHCFARYTC